MKGFSRLLLAGMYVLCSVTFAHADTYWVAFTDKTGTTGRIDHPETFLSANALLRRQAYNIPIDSLDLPVSATYRDSILALGGTFVHQSRWHNGMSIETSDTAVVNKIKACSFVKHVEKTQDSWSPFRRTKRLTVEDEALAGAATLQSDIFIEMLCLDSLHRKGYRGADVQIAVVDNGFRGVNTLDVFSHVNILGTKDFVSSFGSIYAQGEHGTMVLSTLAAQEDGRYIGTAPEASYYLIRSEDDMSESIREVDAMVAAFEWADSVGADIITSSLGYFYFDDSKTDYTYAMHDGKTLRNSIAATIAARKGMLVCVSAGNEGNSDWHYISSPSDADSILTVGAVMSNGMHSYFSSYGPTADGRTKPEVCAMGSFVPLYEPTGVLTEANGTSFSCPITAGMAACLWGALPTLTNMELRQRILSFASHAHAPNNTLGHGIPNAWHSYLNAETAVETLVAEDIDWSQAAIYDMQGRLLSGEWDALQPGIYLLKQGGAIRKIKKG